VRSDPALRATTDIFVTSDHGFATISRSEIDAQHHTTQSRAATFRYDDVPAGFLPPGFLAIDLAQHLGLPLFDPDMTRLDAQGVPQYAQVGEGQHPLAGNGYVGGTGQLVDPPDADVIVNANGGSDLIYIPDGNAERVRDIVAFLASQDYVGALFVDDRYGSLPGALPLSSIALLRAARPRVVHHCSVASAPADSASGARTVLEYQELEGRVYLDRAALIHQGATTTKDCRAAIAESKLP
jgi:hypothetical protein